MAQKDTLQQLSSIESKIVTTNRTIERLSLIKERDSIQRDKLNSELKELGFSTISDLEDYIARLSTDMEDLQARIDHNSLQLENLFYEQSS